MLQVCFTLLGRATRPYPKAHINLSWLANLLCPHSCRLTVTLFSQFGDTNSYRSTQPSLMVHEDVHHDLELGLQPTALAMSLSSCFFFLVFSPFVQQFSEGCSCKKNCWLPDLCGTDLGPTEPGRARWWFRREGNRPSPDCGYRTAYRDAADHCKCWTVTKKMKGTSENCYCLALAIYHLLYCNKYLYMHEQMHKTCINTAFYDMKKVLFLGNHCISKIVGGPERITGWLLSKWIKLYCTEGSIQTWIDTQILHLKKFCHSPDAQGFGSRVQRHKWRQWWKAS